MKRKEIWLPLLVLLPFAIAVFTVFQGLSFALIWDEKIYYRDLLLFKSTGILEFINVYAQPATPFYYYLLYPLVTLTDYAPLPIRIASILFGLGGMVLFSKILSSNKEREPFFAFIKLALFGWFPWYFLCSFLALNDLLSLFLFVGGLYLIETRRHTAGNISLIFSVLTRQFYIFYNFVKSIVYIQ